ncbi:unnamed protein product [Chironomus riparius]|uniref:Ionotropic glutamate receptor C-terminal domain-containing protein n=1 Tax=Chironomus riparius TaxID=315576 RepID=A0A9N9WZW5_9DIPT|nr:unnamed protein product [Chironomus riparius]
MFEYIEIILKVIHLQDQPIKHFVFIPNLSFGQLKSSRIYNYYKKLPLRATNVFIHAYFITNEADTVTLSTVEWFSPHGCNRPNLHKLNVFDKKSQKWSSKLKDYEKFLNYHNCELVMMLPVPLDDGLIYHISGFAIINDDNTNFKIFGISPVIFEMAAKLHNYRPSYQPAYIGPYWMQIIDEEAIDLEEINGKIKEINVYFEISAMTGMDRCLQVSKVVTNLKTNIFVTPGDKYTPYEKFTLPFDVNTWILLFMTFATTFLTILIINRLSKSTQNIVYGDKVETPIWNVIRIFFGISQTKLPNKKFSRFILMIFIYFCLIFRTCFQSKFFEFMTSEPRHPPPKTIENLIDRNYTIYSTQSTKHLFEIEDESLKLLNVKSADPFGFLDAYITQSQNSSAKMALTVDDAFVNYINSKLIKRNHEWNKLETVLVTSQDVFYFYGAAYTTRMLLKIIDNLIPTGVMKFLIEEYYTRKWKFAKDEKGPKILTVDDLAFGFNIWLGSCCISIVGFIIEFIIKFIRKPVKVKYAKVYPVNEESYSDRYDRLDLELVRKFKAKAWITNNLVNENLSEEIEYKTLPQTNEDIDIKTNMLFGVKIETQVEMATDLSS